MRVLIPCRSGSRRIPNKNFLLFNGQPMLLNAVNSLTRAQPKAEVLVFVDSEKAERDVNSWGLQAVIRARTLEEHSETLREFALANFDYLDDYNFLMLPTSVFVNKPIVDKARTAKEFGRSFYVASQHDTDLVDTGQLYGFPKRGLRDRKTLVDLDFCSTAIVEESSVIDINLPEDLEKASKLLAQDGFQKTEEDRFE